MLTLPRIYRTTCWIEIATASQYRMFLAIWILSLISEPIVYMTIWTTITRQSGAVGGYDAGGFAAYYITWMLVRHFAAGLAPQVTEMRVREGAMSMILLRPVHPIHIDLAANVGYKLVALPIVLAIVLGLVLLFRPTFDTPLWVLLLFVPVMLLAWLVRFMAYWILGLLSFWTTRASAFFQAFVVAEIFLTGRIAPLALMPDPVELLATVLPFRWMIAFPVELLLGRVPPQDALFGVGMQVLWLFLEIGLMLLIWRAGLRRYSAVGA